MVVPLEYLILNTRTPIRENLDNMATETKDYTFSGTAAWVSKKPNKYGKYSFNFYPADSNVRRAIVNTGIRNKINEDENGFFFTLRSDEPYPVIDPTGAPIEKMVANGSGVDVALTVETFDSVKHGKVTRSVVKAVVVTNFIEYVPEEKPAASETPLPA